MPLGEAFFLLENVLFDRTDGTGGTGWTGWTGGRVGR